MKIIFIRLSVLTLIMLAIAVMVYQDYHRALYFEANGQVIEAQWNTKNHQMSLFKISSKGVVKELHHYRVTLTEDQIKIGDHFKKISGSNICIINGINVVCVH
jgi:uncharacterized protein YpmS